MAAHLISIGLVSWWGPFLRYVGCVAVACLAYCFFADRAFDRWKPMASLLVGLSITACGGWLIEIILRDGSGALRPAGYLAKAWGTIHVFNLAAAPVAVSTLLFQRLDVLEVRRKVRLFLTFLCCSILCVVVLARIYLAFPLAGQRVDLLQYDELGVFWMLGGVGSLIGLVYIRIAKKPL